MGWEVPVFYEGVAEEHLHTRRAVSIFDLSHTGRIKVSGRQADRLIDRVFACKTDDMTPGQCRAACLCEETGGAIDNPTLARLEDHWLVLCDAEARQRILECLADRSGAQMRVEDTTSESVMLAVQGPRAWALARRQTPFDLTGLQPYELTTGVVMLVRYLAIRISHTGEDGFVLVLPPNAATFAWATLTDAGRVNDEDGVRPAGMAACETLRIEAGMPRCGRELTSEIDPISAGLGERIDMSKRFIGKEAVRRVVGAGPKRVLVGLELAERRMVRPGAAIRYGVDTIGHVTSGMVSPLSSKAIAMGYVTAEYGNPRREVEVHADGQWTPGQVVRLPFYRGAGLRERTDRR